MPGGCEIACIRLILSLSKDEATYGGGAASSFDRLRMRPMERAATSPEAKR